MRLSVRKPVIILVLFFFAFLPLACSQDSEAKKIDLSRKAKMPTLTISEKPVLNIAVGAMITPSEGFYFYRSMFDYIGKRLQIQVNFIDRESYEEVNSLLKSGEIDAAFVCSGPYVESLMDSGIELLVVPKAYGKTVYHSYIIVNSESAIDSLKGLRGKSFAFTDPKSNSGKLVPTYMLARMGETPESFFSKYIYTYAHDKSIDSVALGIVDGAAVDSLVWEYLRKTNPSSVEKTKIIYKSPPYGIPPFVVRKGLDPNLRARLKQIMLDMTHDEEGLRILKGMMLDAFVEGNDSAYDSVRDMQAWINSQAK